MVQNIPGVDGLVSMMHDAPLYVDPEQSLDAGFRWMNDQIIGRKRRKLIRKLAPLSQSTNKNIAQDAINIVRLSLRDGDLEHYGIPKIVNHADELTTPQKKIVAQCAEDLMEYDFLLKNNMTSFSNYRYFSPFWRSAERFKTMNRTVEGFSAIAETESFPDLKALFGEIRDPLRHLARLRQKGNARLFREWLATTAGQTPDGEMVKAYLDAISERKGLMDGPKAKVVKSIAMALVGGVVGSQAGIEAGVLAGTVAGKAAELGTETALGLLDSFVLERDEGVVAAHVL
jgi:hypothetical protein